MRINHLFEKLKESLLSILPVCLLTVLLNLKPIVNFTQRELVIFLASGLCLVIGMAMFKTRGRFCVETSPVLLINRVGKQTLRSGQKINMVKLPTDYKFRRFQVRYKSSQAIFWQPQ